MEEATVSAASSIEYTISDLINPFSSAHVCEES